MSLCIACPPLICPGTGGDSHPPATRQLLDRRYRYREGGRLAAQLLMDGDTGLGAGGGSAVARDYEAEPSASGFSAREFLFAIGLLLSLVEVPVKV